MALNEDNRKDLDRGLRVSPKVEPKFFRKKKDPWLQVKKDDMWARIRENRPHIPR